MYETWVWQQRVIIGERGIIMGMQGQRHVWTSGHARGVRREGWKRIGKWGVEKWRRKDKWARRVLK